MTLRNYNKYFLYIIVFLLSIILFIPKIYSKHQDKLEFLRGSSVPDNVFFLMKKKINILLISLKERLYC